MQKHRRLIGLRPLSGFLFYSSSEIYGDPVADAIPTPETLPGPRVVHRPARLLRRIEALRRDALRDLRAAVRHADQDGAAVQQLRPRPEDHRRARDARLRARHPRRAATSSCSPTASRRARSATSTDSITGYYKVLVRGRAGEPYNVGTERPEISMTELAERVVEAAARAVRLRRQGGARPEPEADYLVDNPNRRCPTSTRRAPSSATTRRSCDRGGRATAR